MSIESELLEMSTVELDFGWMASVRGNIRMADEETEEGFVEQVLGYADYVTSDYLDESLSGLDWEGFKHSRYSVEYSESLTEKEEEENAFLEECEECGETDFDRLSLYLDREIERPGRFPYGVQHDTRFSDGDLTLCYAVRWAKGMVGYDENELERLAREYWREAMAEDEGDDDEETN